MKIIQLIICFLILSISSSALGKPRVLVLHSYHMTDWTNQEQLGIESGLKEFPSIELFVEYMDSKKNTSKQYLDLIEKVFAIKYNSVSFDLIITTDNNALDFILSHRNNLFNSCPIVFCGVNEFFPSMLLRYKNITGVVENVNFDNTIDIALKARPDCDTVFLICDNTETGLINKNDALNALSSKHIKIPIVILKDYSLEDLGNRLRNVNKKEIILYISFWKDFTGNTISPQNLETIFRKSNAPIFGRSEWMVNRGMVGGFCATGYSQGYSAAKLATQIIKGKPIDKLPITTNSENKYLFDYHELKKHKIPLRIVPKESEVINKPFPIRIPAEILTLLIIIFLLLILIIILLFIYIKMRNNSMQKLKDSEEKYRQFVEVTDQVITKLDAQFKITFINQKSEKFFGLSPIDCTKRSISEFIHPEDRVLLVSKLHDSIQKNISVTTIENRVIHAKGECFHFLWTISTLIDNDGKIIGLNAFGRDISSYKEMQNQLQQAQKMKAIGTLAGGIAHDFNNLLAGILGYAEVILLELSPSHLSYPHIQEIRKIALRARDLTRQILSFSRQTPFDPYPVQIHEIIKEVISLLRATIPATIKITTDLQNTGLIFADQTRIHQIVMNLCTNSFHAMEEKGGELSISVNQQSISDKNSFDLPSGNYVVLSIKDTGTGIPSKLQPHIFDPFFTTKKNNRGTGLGLSVVHGIVTELNSFIRFKSEYGKGSCFTIYFPLFKGNVIKSSTTEISILNGNENIIIVDDEEVVAGSLNALLKKHGYGTHVFTNSKQALEMIKSGKLKGDLLITDLTMPEVSGLDLVNEVSKSFPELPIILCTGYNDMYSKEKLDKSKIVTLMIKPVDIDNLLKTIRSAFERNTISQNKG